MRDAGWIDGTASMHDTDDPLGTGMNATPNDRAWRPTTMCEPTTPPDSMPTRSGAGSREPTTCWRAWSAASAVALLVGIGLGGLVIGLLERFYVMMDPSSRTWRTVLGAVLLALALGPRLSDHLALHLARRVWRRVVGGRTSLVATMPIPIERRDHGLMWMLQGLVALTCGFLTLLAPALVVGGEALHAVCLREFVWMPGTLTVVEAFVVLISVALPVSLIGFCVTCLHHVGPGSGRWNVPALGVVLAGCGFSLAVTGIVGPTTLPGNQWMMLGALPFFLAAIISVRQAGAIRETPASRRQAVNEPGPEVSDPWPMLLRVAVACVAACGALLMAVWLRTITSRAGDTGAWIGGAVMLAAAGLGILLTSRPGTKPTRSIGGFGVCCVAAGLAVGTAMIALGTLAEVAPRNDSGAAPVAVGVGLCLTLGAFGVGCAAAYGQRAVLWRAGSAAGTGAAMLSAAALLCGLLVWFGLVPLLDAFGAYTALAAVALTLVGLGGALVIHEPAYSRRVRRYRLCGVFATLVVLSVALPVTGRRVHAALSSSRNATRAPTVTPATVDALLAPFDTTPSRVALIGDDFPAVAGDDPGNGRVVDRFRFADAAPNHQTVGVAGHTGYARGDALRALRVTRDRYDLLVASLASLPPGVRHRVLSRHFLGRLRGVLAPEALAMVMTPIDASQDCDESRLRELLGVVAPQEAVVQCVTGRSSPHAVLVFGNGPDWRVRWHRLQESGGADAVVSRASLP